MGDSKYAQEEAPVTPAEPETPAPAPANDNQEETN